MLTIEAAIVIPVCFLVLIISITSSTSLYEEINKECREESQLALARRDCNEVWNYKIFKDEKTTSVRKCFSVNPVKLINYLYLINDTKSIIEENLKIAEELKGIFYYEK